MKVRTQNSKAQSWKAFIAGSALVFAACGGVDSETSVLENGLVEDGTPEAFSILTFVNGPKATFAVLDDDVGLDRRAAQNIVDHIRGRDGARGTSDDNPVDTILELDTIKYVGTRVIGQLLHYVSEMQNDAIVIEGVEMTQVQLNAILMLVNQASLEQLDDEVGLNSRAATSLVNGRPFANIEEVAAARYIGGSAIRALLAFVVSREGRDLPYMTIEGVSFTEREARAALDVANRATLVQLDDDAGLDQRAATNIESARPIGDLEELAAISYVGRTALTQIRDFAATWAPPTTACMVELRPARNDFAVIYSQLLGAAGARRAIGQVVALSAQGCTDIVNRADARRAIGEAVAQSVLGARLRDITIGAVTLGGRKFGFALRATEQDIDARVAAGDWNPATDRANGGLYPRKGELLQNLRREVERDPGSFVEFIVDVGRGRCGENATVLFDTRDATLLVVHRADSC